jgi:hypothetical protein
VAADVLLLGGSKGFPYLKPGLRALEQILPRARRIEFPGLDHGGSSDVSNINRAGKPEVVAPELRPLLRPAVMTQRIDRRRASRPINVGSGVLRRRGGTGGIYGTFTRELAGLPGPGFRRDLAVISSWPGVA